MSVGAVGQNRNIGDGVEQDLVRLREATDKVVGVTFFGTMLKAMRQSEIRGRYGHGGRGEEVFSEQLHGVYAERMGASMRAGLQQRMYERMEKQQRMISFENHWSRSVRGMETESSKGGEL